MTSVGDVHRTQRKMLGQEVTEIADKLCITSSYVSAIERDDLKNLPGVFFYKSFVKQYAAIVGVDYSSLQSDVEALAAAEEPPALPSADSRLTLALRSCTRIRTWWRGPAATSLVVR
jgi:cytoskeletal protein RodZ